MCTQKQTTWLRHCKCVFSSSRSPRHFRHAFNLFFFLSRSLSLTLNSHTHNFFSLFILSVALAYGGLVSVGVSTRRLTVAYILFDLWWASEITIKSAVTKAMYGAAAVRVCGLHCVALCAYTLMMIFTSLQTIGVCGVGQGLCALSDTGVWLQNVQYDFPHICTAWTDLSWTNWYRKHKLSNRFDYVAAVISTTTTTSILSLIVHAHTT